VWAQENGGNNFQLSKSTTARKRRLDTVTNGKSFILKNGFI